MPTSKPPKESTFQHRVVADLKKIPHLHFFVIQAVAIRGIPDILGVANGVFFAWELKRDRKEANKKSGRSVLQGLILGKIREAGGIGEFVYPENYQEQLKRLLLAANLELSVLRPKPDDLLQ